MMKSILILISAIALLGCQTPSVEPDGSGVTILKNVEITSVQKPPFPSGVIATYSLIGVKNQNGDVFFCMQVISAATLIIQRLEVNVRRQCQKNILKVKRKMIVWMPPKNFHLFLI